MANENQSVKKRRKERLVKNTKASLVFQVTSIVSGFVLPKLILHNFGSEINGLVNSIAQFLQMISFLELGIGAVIQSSLYKPLADNDYKQVSRIVVSASRFFKRLAKILLVYVLILLAVYPYIAGQDYGHLYTAALIVAMSASSFCQYYFGIVNQLLLTADQRGYIQYNTQTITIVLNTLACVILIQLGASIHIVKLATALIFLARPVVLRLYVDRKYTIDRKITYTEEPIQQKWNGVAQHVAAVVLDSTANVILTVFATLSDVSIYSVYHLVLYGLKTLYTSMTTGIRSLLGELWAKKELSELSKTFGWVEWLLNTGAVLIFGCTGTLILPFVAVYTKGITDADYIQPLFAALITFAQAGHCLRLPYNMMILAAGHYKQTQSNYLIAAALNILISIIMVKCFGLVGVAIGTLVAMAYQTVWMALYNSRNIIKWPFKNFIKQIGIDALSVALGILATRWLVLGSVTYRAWILLAIMHAVIWIFVVIFVNMLFYKDKMSALGSKLIKRFRKLA